MSNWWSYGAIPTYRTEYGQELAYIKTYPHPDGNGRTYHKAVVKGRTYPHQFDSVDECAAYVETLVTLQRR